MSVTVTEKPASRTGGVNHLYQRAYSRTFIAVTDAATVGARAVEAAAGIPQVGTTYDTGTETDTGAFVQTVDAREVSIDGKQWEVAVVYGPYNAATFPSTPTTWPIKLTWGAQKFERVITKDSAGTIIRNSAKEPFADPVVIDDSRPILTVVRNELVSSFDNALASTYRDTVNTALWNGAAAKTVKCNSITTGEPQFHQDVGWYYQVTYVFEYNRDLWQKVLLDQGYAELDSSSPARPKAMIGPDGHDIKEPVPLDGSGHRLATNVTPVWLTFDVYPSSDFSAFNLDFTRRLGT